MYNLFLQCRFGNFFLFPMGFPLGMWYLVVLKTCSVPLGQNTSWFANRALRPLGFPTQIFQFQTMELEHRFPKFLSGPGAFWRRRAERRWDWRYSCQPPRQMCASPRAQTQPDLNDKNHATSLKLNIPIGWRKIANESPALTCRVAGTAHHTSAAYQTHAQVIYRAGHPYTSFNF